MRAAGAGLRSRPLGGAARSATTGRRLRRVDDAEPRGAGASVAELIGGGDVLVISIADLPQVGELHTMEVRVGERVAVPVLGPVPIVGATTAAVREDRRLREEELLRDPRVTVSMAERRAPRFTVVGAVRAPGRRLLPRAAVSLAEALALAGGLRPDAAHEAWVQGPSGDRRVDLGAGRRVQLLAGDVLHVPAAGRYVVTGHVARPGEYRLRRRTTVLQALALAGGVDGGGSLEQARLHRGASSLPIDVAAVVHGDARDVELAGGDVLEVPRDVARWLLDGGRSLLRGLNGGDHAPR